MKARLYLLEGTFPTKVIIKNNQITKEYTYQNAEEFINDIDNLFEKSNNKDTMVLLLLEPSKCRNICADNVFGIFQETGYNNLKNYGDIRFYQYDCEHDTEIFEDIYKKCIQETNNELINKSLQKDLDIELVKKGEKLIKEIKCELLEINKNKDLVEYVQKEILTDESLELIAKKYNIISVDNLKASIYAIYETFNNQNDIKQIIRNWILSTEPVIKNNDFTTLTPKFEIIAKLCSSVDREYLTFEEIEVAIKDKFNYLMIIYNELLEGYNYQITSIDFNNKLIYFKPYYY